MAWQVVAGKAAGAGASKRIRRRLALGCLVAIAVPVAVVFCVAVGVIGGAQMVLGGFDEAEGLASASATAGTGAGGGLVSFDPSASTFVDRGGSANAWGGHSNGRIPDSGLCTVAHQPGLRARCDATAALARMSAEFAAEFGQPMHVSDAYRDYPGQVKAKHDWCARGRCNMAATPGTSNHGWGLAFDLGSGINSYDTPQYAWMKVNGARFGFYHPTWAEPDHPDYAKPEPWHWQYIGLVSTGSGR
ncbi:hypothetical protein AGMMS50218_15240 [Actinomycetota bacterium]|nr:hypothetical protein AGMMS50218_15240 [Actinomycetota bacterium]